MRTRIFVKLFTGLCIMISLSLLSIYFFTGPVMESTYLASRWREMADKAAILESMGVSAANPARLREIARAAGVRITLFGRDDRVLNDSENPNTAATGDLPEVRAARGGNSSSQTRLDPANGVVNLYYAVPIGEGVLRLSVPRAGLQRDIAAIRNRALQSTTLGFVPVVLIALFIAQRTSFRLGTIIAYAGEVAKGNFHARLPDYRSGELAVLGRKLNESSAELERTVQQLQTEHAELEKLERVRKDFVINVSHELRTPLASIQGYTETLMDGALHDEAHNMRFLTIIRHNAERLARLTEDLLALSRIELKRQEFRIEPYQVNSLLADVIDTLRPIADKKHIALLRENAPAGTEVFCDSEALFQILSNLVDNAVKYTPERGTITVGTQTAEQGRHMIEFFVRDSGVGIPAEDLPRLFERFYRVDKARSRELGGTGLGLAIVKHLVRTQGGEVRVESELHRGSTFFFTLPVEADLAAVPELHPEFTAL